MYIFEAGIECLFLLTAVRQGGRVWEFIWCGKVKIREDAGRETLEDALQPNYVYFDVYF